MSLRAEKVASVIKRVLAKPISDLANEFFSGLVTITAVRLSNDLHIAKVYCSIFSIAPRSKQNNTEEITPGKFISILEENKGSLRYKLGQELKLRYTPELHFFIDDTLDQMQHIKELLDSINKK